MQDKSTQIEEEKKNELTFDDRCKSILATFHKELGSVLETHTTEELKNSFLLQYMMANDHIGDKLKRLSLSPKAKSPEKIILEVEQEKTDDQVEEKQIVSLLNYLDEEIIVNQNDALEILNSHAAGLGYSFKKGQSSKTSSGSYFALHCRFKMRKGTDKKKCLAHYNFKCSNERYELTSYSELHNHGPIKFEDLTDGMKKDIIYFSRSRKVCEIVEYLKKKHMTDISYWAVYYEFRLAKPLFGDKDCENFKEFLLSKYSEVYLEQDGQGHTKQLFFATPVMKRNYQLFGDIVLIDATYNVNKYQVPVVIFTGIRNSGENTIFGIAIVNDETAETYNSVFRAFFKAHGSKFPNLIVTDGDLALGNAVGLYRIEHHLCQWHIIRNIERKTKGLKKKSEDHYKIFKNLPFIEAKEEFDEDIKSLKNYFVDKELSDLDNYLEYLLKSKEKWANSYKSRNFNAGASTTSRGESNNALLKHYVNRTSELSALIPFIEKFEALSDKIKISKEEDKVEDQLYVDPLLQSIKEHTGTIIYKHHERQYLMSKKYTSRIHSNEKPSWEVLIENVGDSKKDVKSRIVTDEGNVFKCKCIDYETSGILCRHIFCVFQVLQIKNASPFIHPRWLVSNLDLPEIHNFSESEKRALIKRDEEFELNEAEQEKVLGLDIDLSKDKKSKISKESPKQTIKNFQPKSSQKQNQNQRARRNSEDKKPKRNSNSSQISTNKQDLDNEEDVPVTHRANVRKK